MAGLMPNGFPSELDRWRTAQQLINRHGEGAEMEAAQRADQAKEQERPDGERLWLDLMNKVRALQMEEPPAGSLH